MEHIRLGSTVGVLAYILESGGSAVEPVGDYHLVLYKNCAHLAAAAI